MAEVGQAKLSGSFVELLIGLLLFALFLVSVAFDWLPWIRGSVRWGWQWHYEPVDGFRPLVPVGLLLLLGFVLFRRMLFPCGLGPTKARVASWLVAAMFWWVFFQLTVANLGQGGLAKIPATVASRWATEFFTYASRIKDYPDFIKNYHEYQKTMLGHPRSYPPGPVSYFYLIQRIFERYPSLCDFGWRWLSALVPNVDLLCREPISFRRSQVVSLYASAYLLFALSSLMLIPAWLLVRQLVPEEHSLRSVLLYVVCPSFYLFSPQVGMLFPTSTLFVLWLACKGENSGKLYWDALAGAALALGLWWTLSMALVGLCIAMMMVLRLVLPGAGADDAHQVRVAVFRRLVLFLGIPVVFYLVMAMATGFRLWDLVLHAQVIVPETRRPDSEARVYGFWCWFNLVDFALFLGLPVVYFLARESLRLRRASLLESIEGRLLVAFVITLMALSFSGIVLAEAGRIWGFLMPIPLALATASLMRRNPWSLPLCFVLQLLQLLVMRMAWNPVRLEPGLVELFAVL